MSIGLGLGSYGVIIEEADGSPTGFGTRLKVNNDALTDNGDGSFTIDLTVGGVTDHGALNGLSDDDHTQYHTATRANTWLGTKSLSDIGTKDHDLLDGLSDDDHSQYGLLVGRAGGQTLIGGAASGEGLTLNSTSHATKGLISIGGTLYVDEVNNRIGIGEDSPDADLTINATGGNNLYIYRYGNNANPPSILNWKSRGTEGSKTKVSDGDDTGKFESWAWSRNQGDTDDAWVRTGMMIAEVDGLDAQDRLGGRFVFYTSSGVSITPTKKFIVGKDHIEITKIATATAGTQYDSWDFRFRCSVWDSTNTQAEDRLIYARTNAGSGVDGSEPYDLTFYDNDDNALLIINPLTPTIQVQQYIGHIDDSNTALEFGEDRLKIACGGVVGFDFFETTQDVMYIGNGALGVGGVDIDIYIGTNNAIQIAGDTGVVTLGVAFSNTGLRILDTNASHDLVIAPGSDLSADRTLTLTTGDSDRTITLSGNPTLDDWFDQAVKQASSPTFGGLTMNGDIDLTKEGTATGGSDVYDSRSLTLTASSWLIGTGARDRKAIIRNFGVVSDNCYLGIFLDGAPCDALQIHFNLTDGDNQKLYIPSKITHLGDTNTYFSFVDNDSIAISAGELSKFELKYTSGDSANSYKSLSTGNGTIYTKIWNQSLGDDATFSLSVSVDVMMKGFITASTGTVLDEWAEFLVDGDGDVTITNGSINISNNSDTNGDLCIGTDSNQEPLIIKNRLGGTRDIFLRIEYV